MTDDLGWRKNMPAIFIGFLVAVFAIGIIVLLISLPFGLIVIGLGGLLVGASLQVIPAAPPHVGVLTVWGRRTNVVKKEGYVLLAPFFPFYVDVILVKVEKINLNFEPFKDVRCRVGTEETDNLSRNEIQSIVLTRQAGDKISAKSGGAVTVNVSVTYEVDRNEVIAFLNAGGQEGVKDILRDIIAEDVRQIGAFLTWEMLAFSQNFVTVRLIYDITGNVPDDSFEDLSRKQAGKLRGNYSEDEIQRFLNQYIQNGLSTLADLGIRIRRLNVVNVEPEGELKQDAERNAREIQQRRAEVFEAETLAQTIAKLQTLSGLSNQEILNAIQAERGKATKHVIEGSVGQALAALLAKSLSTSERTDGKRESNDG